ncbi:hypothetical protein JCM19992_25460 [Thermostilla marina]
MAIHFRCENCGKNYAVKDSLAGRRAECRCGAELQIPIPFAATEDDDGGGEGSPSESIPLWEDGDSIEADVLDPRVAAARSPSGKAREIPPFEFVVGQAERKKAVTAIVYGSFVTLVTASVPLLVGMVIPSPCCVLSMGAATLLSVLGGVLLIVGGIQVLKQNFLGVSLIGMGAAGIAAIPGASAAIMFFWHLFSFELRGIIQAVTMAAVFMGVPIWLGLWAYRLERRRREHYRAFTEPPGVA